MSRNKKSPEEFDDDLFDDFDDVSSIDPRENFWRYLDETYGHGYVSSDADGVRADELSRVQHFIQSDDEDDDEELPDDMTEDELREIEASYDKYAQEWARKKIQSIHEEKYDKDSFYFSAVPDDVKKAFDASAIILRKLAIKNGGQAEVDDEYDPTWNMASVTLSGKGFHFENDRAFRAILKFFTSFSINCQKKNGVSMSFEKANYYNQKEM